jgi:prevent-host-death family protein
MNATARDMRYHLKSVMQAVERGEEVFITNRGRIKARILAVNSRASQASAAEEKNPFVGMWRDRDEIRDVKTYVRRIRRGRFS